MKLSFIATVIFFSSSLSFADGVRDITLRNGETYMVIAEVNGENSGDFRAGLVTCDNGTSKNRRLMDRNLNQGFWPIISFNNQGSRASGTMTVFDPQKEERERVRIICLNERSQDTSSSQEVSLKSGETHMVIIEVNGENSGDFRAGLITCDNGTSKNRRLMDRNLNQDFWPIISFNNQGSRASGNMTVFNPQTEQRERIEVVCLDETAASESNGFADGAPVEVSE